MRAGRQADDAKGDRVSLFLFCGASGIMDFRRAMSLPTIFISYSQQDKLWRERLVTQLTVLKQEGILDSWDECCIEAGADSVAETEQAIQRACVAIILISADYLTSDAIRRDQIFRLLARREKENLRVVPLIVRPCALDQVKWLAGIQPRPKDRRPLSRRSEERAEEDLADLVREVAGIVCQACPEARKDQLDEVKPGSRTRHPGKRAGNGLSNDPSGASEGTGEHLRVGKRREGGRKLDWWAPHGAAHERTASALMESAEEEAGRIDNPFEGRAVDTETTEARAMVEMRKLELRAAQLNLMSAQLELERREWTRKFGAASG